MNISQYISLSALGRDIIIIDNLKECRKFVSKFKSGNIGCEILKEQEIIRLCNLINNPAYVHVEDTELCRLGSCAITECLVFGSIISIFRASNRLYFLNINCIMEVIKSKDYDKN